MTCAICHDALMFPKKSEIERIERPVSDLQESARTCKYCRVILCIFEEIDIETIGSFFIIPAIDWGGLMPWAPRGSIILNITWKPDHPIREAKVRSWVAFAIRNLAGVRETDYESILVPGVVNTGSDASIAWVTEKIKDCKESHRKCNVHTHGALPDRVVKISRAGSAKANPGESWYESDVSLYETRDEDLPYAALSHRWGDEQPLRLLKENLDSFRKSIEWSKLPKTFQDAIVFARKLGIEYIWIDSLCIIQDSKEDWFEQSGKMAGIYEHATVTLAILDLEWTLLTWNPSAKATVANNGREGCFVEPSPYLRGCVTDGKTNMLIDGNEQRIKQLVADASDDLPVVYVKQDTEHQSPGHWTSNTLPLLTRGWVCQERLLSPRIIHFGSVDLIWECNERLHCHCGYYQPSGSRNPISHPIKPQHAICLIANGDESYPLHSRWVQLTEEYTALDLTFASDRIAAIAGVAKQFRRGLKNKTYLAGLWEESLITGMTWQRACPREKRTRPAEPSEGPSWSWLSVTGPIKYPTSRYVGQAPGTPPIVEHVSFRHDNDLEFMKLWGGAVTLHGKLVEAKLRILYTSNGLRSTVFAPGWEGMYDVELDYEPDEDELHRVWRTVHPRWSQKAFGGDAAEVYPLPDDEDMDETLPFYMEQEDYIGTKQSINEVYCFWMGVRIEEGVKGTLAQSQSIDTTLLAKTSLA
ncbi:hypothetical protein SLS60_005905 [Paraconiothyrium brasiliense]|uniref:Heterokaryon incompatibility domain-containing protein n=1 Tax=Paraconiothyrium brasiliense TaxID=300254 RepID=A0ABR3RED4_9PLEO